MAIHSVFLPEHTTDGEPGGLQAMGAIRELDTAKHTAHTRRHGKHPVHKVSIKQTPIYPRREAI